MVGGRGCEQQGEHSELTKYSVKRILIETRMLWLCCQSETTELRSSHSESANLEDMKSDTGHRHGNTIRARESKVAQRYTRVMIRLKTSVEPVAIWIVLH